MTTDETMERERVNALRAGVFATSVDATLRHRFAPEFDSTQAAIASDTLHILDGVTLRRTQHGICWLDTSGVSQRRARRLIWNASVGSVEAGTLFLAQCSTSRCVNPDHLMPVSSLPDETDAVMIVNDSWICDPVELCDPCSATLGAEAVLFSRASLGAFLFEKVSQEGREAAAMRLLNYVASVLLIADEQSRTSAVRYPEQ